MNISPSPLSTSNDSGTSTKEFSIRVPKNQKKKYHIMRFNSNLNIDFAKWKQIKMERQNNRVEKHTNEEMPKYGAGSEFKRDEKEEARKKRLGYTSKNYKPDDQPWILKCGGKNGKKFRGFRDGGVGENAAYYIFTHGKDGSFEAYPVTEWYNFQPVQRFKALSAEEAEEEFGKRNRSLNYFSLMMRKKFHKDEDDEMDEEGGSKKSKKKGLKISDMDDWVDSDNDDGDESDEDGSKEKESKQKTVKKKVTEKKKANDTDESAFEDSDDGDEEGRELDYISDSSDSVSDNEAKMANEMKGVSDESALRNLLTSDEEEEEEGEKSGEEGNKSEKEDPAANEETPQTSTNVKKKRKKETIQTKNSSCDGPSKNKGTSSDTSDSEGGKMNEPKQFLNSHQTSSTESLNRSERFTKKPRLDSPGELGISEEAVRRYLTRKPMTYVELLLKFKKRKTNLSSEQLTTVMTDILKKINHTKKSNKLYLTPENFKKKSLN